MRDIQEQFMAENSVFIFFVQNEKEREQIEQELLTASEDELEVKRAYYKAVCADILTLKGALEERQSKGTVKALSMEEKMALAEKKY